ncbi:MAG: DNA polymerase III subunit delta [Pseudomonadota bacterium]
MKLAGRESARFCANPDTSLKGALIHGPDAGMVAARRRDLVKSLLGSDADDLRTSQLQAADVRKDISTLDTELKSRGFFPGRRIVIVDSATDGLSKALAEVLDSTTTEDAFLILTAGVLPARSSLRKFFEGSNALVSLQQFQEAPSPADLQDMLRSGGARHGIEPDALDLLTAYAQTADYGSVLQIIDLISIFSISSELPINTAEVGAILPTGQDSEIDRFVDTVAHGNAAEVAPVLRRLQTGGVNAVSILIALQRLFRQLILASSAPGGPEAGLSLIRPPLWGARKSAMQSLLRRWAGRRLEQANQILFEADGAVRSSGNAPDMAMVERCALRLAMMARGSR